jgi:hypothetical protein
MKSLLFAGVMAGAGALACAAPASASVFDLSFSGTGISGELVLSLGSGPSPYTVTGIDAGSWVDIGGTTYTISSLATYAGDDQKAYFPASSLNGFVDFPGISVAFGTGDALNLFAFSPTSYGVLLKDQNAAGNPGSGPYYAVTVTDGAPSITASAPELSTWAMLGVGFGGLALVATRRRKTPIAALG